MLFDFYKMNLIDQLRKFESRQERRKNIFFFNLPRNLMFYLIFFLYATDKRKPVVFSEKSTLIVGMRMLMQIKKKINEIQAEICFICHRKKYFTLHIFYKRFRHFYT